MADISFANQSTNKIQMDESPHHEWPLRHTRSAGSVVWLRKGFLAIMDQGILSGANFLVAILLARWLTPESYGSYALAFEIFLLVAVIYGALILEPMSVFGASVYGGNLVSYYGKLLRIHCVVSSVMVVLLFVVAGILHAMKPASLLPDPLVAVAIATPCLLLFWLARRGFYVVFMPRKALAGSCIYSALVVAGVAVLYKLRCLSATSAFLLLAAGSLVTGPLMFRWLKPKLVAKAPEIRLRDICRRHWTYGRWAVANSLVIWLSLAIYYPLLGSFYTLADAGKFKALMNFASPIGQALFALSMLTLPYVSREHHADGNVVANRLVWRLTFYFMGGACLYWVVVLLLRNPALHLLYGGKFGEIVTLLPWVALGSVLRMSAVAPEIVLKAMHSPASAFVAYSAACVVAILVGVPCTRKYGLTGALLAWVLSSATALGAAIVMIRRKSSRLSARPYESTSTLVVAEQSPQKVEVLETEISQLIG